METSTAIQSTAPPAPPSPPPAAPRRKEKSPLVQILEVAASLKITVTLFALSMVLVFFGTLAQVETGIWDVVNKYFRSIIVWVPVKVWTWYLVPVDSAAGKFAIPFPGGWLLGGLLFTNLLAAHIIRFKLAWSRVGIILLHLGIILMMLGEFFTGVYAIEGMMTIRAGETVNFVEDTKQPELAIEDVTDPNRKEDDVVAIYLPALLRGGKISEESLPFTVEVLEYHKNSDFPTPKDDPKAATHGQAKGRPTKGRPEGTGVDPDQRVDMPTAMVRLKSNKGADLGTYLLSTWIGQPDTIEIDGKKYEVSLRRRRSYRDYTVRLDKAEENKHPNLDMAKDFSSYITLNDPANGVVNRPIRIYMNAPLRYRGEAFFQANMATDRDGNKVTGLQVVRNELIVPGLGTLPFWMLPYISCVVVALGMMFHFGVKLFAFLKREITAPLPRAAS